MKRRRMRASFRIAQNAAGHVEDTKPELMFDQMLLYHFGVSFQPLKPVPVQIKDDEGAEFTFKPDRQISSVYVEIDGPYHRSARQRIKTAWRDDLIWANTHRRVLHIDSELLIAKKHWGYVAKEIGRFLASTEVKGHVFA